MASSTSEIWCQLYNFLQVTAVVGMGIVNETKTKKKPYKLRFKNLKNLECELPSG